MVEADREADLGLMQDILASSLPEYGSRYSLHPGDIAWWVHHEDPRRSGSIGYWLWEERGFVVFDGEDIAVFTRPGEDVVPLIEWSQDRLDGRGTIGWVSDRDQGLIDYLHREGYGRTDDGMNVYHLELATVVRGPTLPAGWEIRPLQGEHEADSRRRASHRAFRSTMGEVDHLDRYLRFMRSPVYVPGHDLVALAPDGRVAAFMIWWGDRSGVAQIEPFGTDPDYQRQGVGHALINHGLTQMSTEGMVAARVCTEPNRPGANQFYLAAGFTRVDLLGWWRRG